MPLNYWSWCWLEYCIGQQGNSSKQKGLPCGDLCYWLISQRVSRTSINVWPIKVLLDLCSQKTLVWWTEIWLAIAMESRGLSSNFLTWPSIQTQSPLGEGEDVYNPTTSGYSQSSFSPSKENHSHLQERLTVGKRDHNNSGVTVGSEMMIVPGDPKYL